MEIRMLQRDYLRKQLVQRAVDKNSTSIIDLVNQIIELAWHLGASDIHLDPTGKSMRMRLRIDGMLQDEPSLPKIIHLEIISRIKILAGLRIDEHQIPQDGRFQHTIAENTINLRVSIVPTYYGENAVLRLLQDKNDELNLEYLGFSKSDREKISKAMRSSHGIVLATGPTGSGKTTTLYTLIKVLNAKHSSIITIEDPIEYSLDGVNQIGVNPKAGLTFANGLRAMLRQDPNNMMVGEIRDRETASLAINAALTGHLVLSTLHTNDAVSTIPRLVDLGIESYLIASTINLVIAQRLARKICRSCKRSIQPTKAQMQYLRKILESDAPKGFSQGKGCPQCDNTGYRGRISVNEVLAISPSLRSVIHQKCSLEKMRREAKKEGVISMIKDGFQKAASGITTIEEITRIFHE